MRSPYSWSSPFAYVRAPQGAVLEPGRGAVHPRAHPHDRRQGEGDAAAGRAHHHLGAARGRRPGQEAGSADDRGVGARGPCGPHGAPRGPRSRRRAEAVRRAGAPLPGRARAATRASSSCRSGRATPRRCRCSELMPEEGGGRRPRRPRGQRRQGKAEKAAKARREARPRAPRSAAKAKAAKKASGSRAREKPGPRPGRRALAEGQVEGPFGRPSRPNSGLRTALGGNGTSPPVVPAPTVSPASCRTVWVARRWSTLHTRGQQERSLHEHPGGQSG